MRLASILRLDDAYELVYELLFQVGFLNKRLTGSIELGFDSVKDGSLMGSVGHSSTSSADS